MKDLKPDIRRICTEMEKIICAEIMAGSDPWTTLGFDHDQLMNTFNDAFNEVYAAYVKDEIVGAIIIQTKGAFSGYLKSIAVKSGWRDKHLGKMMMKFIENIVFSNSTNLFLCVSSFNPDAKRFYLKLGYQVVGELKNYLVEGHNEILMRKTTGPILEKSQVSQ